MRIAFAFTGAGHGTMKAIRSAIPIAEVDTDTETQDLPHPNTMLFTAVKDGKIHSILQAFGTYYEFTEKYTRGDLALIKATDGIEGLPAFDGNAVGNKGWHVSKETAAGVDTLTFRWYLGTMFIVR